MTGTGQLGGQLAAVWRDRGAGDEAAVVETAQDGVHRLAGDEDPARQLGVRQSGALPEQLQARVLGHGQV